MHWLAHGLTERQLAKIYHVGATSVHRAIHEGLPALKTLAQDAIQLPRGESLLDTMAAFEIKSGLPMCAGGLDGTFMKIRKPERWGDTYWCYKTTVLYITIMAVVDCEGLFTYVDAGRAGCLGDAFTWNHCSLKQAIDSDRLLNEHQQIVGGTVVRPYLVADSAFALTSRLLKGFQHPPTPGLQAAFNSAVVSARRCTEIAFGHLKGRWGILTRNNISDPNFAADVAIVCCGLHNICLRANSQHHAGWLPEDGDNAGNVGAAHEHDGAGNAQVVRTALAHYVFQG